MRRYSDAQLIDAIRASHSWRGVLRALGLSATSAAAMRSVRLHANRLELDYSHFTGQRRWTGPQQPAGLMHPQQANLARVGALMAAAWFELCGHAVSWPLELCRYDLLVWIGRAAKRFQVKTTTVKQGTSWTVWISNSGKERTTYDPDEIDYDLIPVAAVGGSTAIRLSAYQDYRLRDAHSASSEAVSLNGQEAIQPDQPDHDDHRAQRVR
jgi:hypothetical protein